eukprot:752852-Hanusia_phi.AAC.2
MPGGGHGPWDTRADIGSTLPEAAGSATRPQSAPVDADGDAERLAAGRTSESRGFQARKGRTGFASSSRLASWWKERNVEMGIVDGSQSLWERSTPRLTILHSFNSLRKAELALSFESMAGASSHEAHRTESIACLQGELPWHHTSTLQASASKLSDVIQVKIWLSSLRDIT